MESNLLINEIKENDNEYIKFFVELFEIGIKNIITEDYLKKYAYESNNRNLDKIEINFRPEGGSSIKTIIDLVEDIINPIVYEKCGFFKKRVKKYNNYPISDMVKKIKSEELYYYNNLMSILLENSEHIKIISKRFSDVKVTKESERKPNWKLELFF